MNEQNRTGKVGFRELTPTLTLTLSETGRRRGAPSAESADLLEAAAQGRGMHWEPDDDDEQAADAAVKAVAALASQKEARLRGMKDVRALVALTRRLPFFRMFSEEALAHLCQVRSFSESRLGAARIQHIAPQCG